LNINTAGIGFPSSSLSNSTPATTLTITLSSAVTAFGLDFTTPGGVDGVFSLSNGFTSNPIPTTAFGPAQFEGFVSDTAFNTITLTVPTDGFFVFDLTTAVAAVPEPSTWAMMLLGFLGVGFMAYRKKTTVRFA
jgi:hypothetical protein